MSIFSTIKIENHDWIGQLVFENSDTTEVGVLSSFQNGTSSAFAGLFGLRKTSIGELAVSLVNCDEWIRFVKLI
jgi:hypothetical protein